MALSPTEISLLQTELATDPQSMGYAAVAGDNRAIASLLNTVDPLGQKGQKKRIEVSDLHTAIDPTEYEALTNAKRAEWLVFITAMAKDGVQRVPGQLSPWRLVRSVFPNGTTTWANIQALRDRTLSRGEAVIGREYAFSLQDVRAVVNG